MSSDDRIPGKPQFPSDEEYDEAAAKIVEAVNKRREGSTTEMVARPRTTTRS